MKTFVLSIAMLASVNTFAQVVYTDSADLSSSTMNHAIVDAEYKLVATETTTRKVPGCVINSENYPETCEEVVVVKSEPVVALNVAYFDPTFVTEGHNLSYVTFTFKTSDFSAEDVAALKAASPLWRHPFSNAGRNFARKHFSLQVKKAVRTISIVDVRNSTLCSYGDNYPETEVGCVERLAYKNVTTVVNEVSAIKK